MINGTKQLFSKLALGLGGLFLVSGLASAEGISFLGSSSTTANRTASTKLDSLAELDLVQSSNGLIIRVPVDADGNELSEKAEARLYTGAAEPGNSLEAIMAAWDNAVDLAKGGSNFLSNAEIDSIKEDGTITLTRGWNHWHGHHHNWNWNHRHNWNHHHWHGHHWHGHHHHHFVNFRTFVPRYYHYGVPYTFRAPIVYHYTPPVVIHRHPVIVVRPAFRCNFYFYRPGWVW